MKAVRGCAPPPPEEVDLLSASGRVLAAHIVADRDYPPTARSIRDGFAVRSADLPGEFEIAGEVRAGARYEGEIGVRQAVEIMTGAPVPGGADQVVMVEHTSRNGRRMATERLPAPGEFINAQGCEARRGDRLLERGVRLDYAGIAVLATVGQERVSVYAKPRVAIIPTGDEVVRLSATPLDYQVRNSNAHSLAVQVARAGGEPDILPIAADDASATRELIEQGLRHDLMLLSGGVSAGKYDVVEAALAEAGAEFYFDRVLIQPGQPLVFGRAQGTFFFGLPGNPVSTMVTFEMFARAALELLAGQEQVTFPLSRARLTQDFAHKPGLTRFLPARLASEGLEVTPLRWSGSSDVSAQAHSNVYLVADADRECWKAGEWIEVLPK